MTIQFASDHIIRDEKTLRSLFPPTHDLAIKKVQNSLDRHARDFINRSPFLCIGTQNQEGKADVSPRGDQPGFVKILDSHTLAIPDRPGNNRLDTQTNILGNPNVGLLFLIPGFDDTLRINGKAGLVTEPGLLASMVVNGKTPKSRSRCRLGRSFCIVQRHSAGHAFGIRKRFRIETPCLPW